MVTQISFRKRCFKKSSFFSCFWNFLNCHFCVTKQTIHHVMYVEQKSAWWIHAWILIFNVKKLFFGCKLLPRFLKNCFFLLCQIFKCTNDKFSLRILSFVFSRLTIISIFFVKIEARSTSAWTEQKFKASLKIFPLTLTVVNLVITTSHHLMLINSIFLIN